MALSEAEIAAIAAATLKVSQHIKAGHDGLLQPADKGGKGK